MKRTVHQWKHFQKWSLNVVKAVVVRATAALIVGLIPSVREMAEAIL